MSREPRIPLADTETFAAAVRRTRRIRLGLGAGLVIAAALVLAASLALRPAKPSLVPPGTSGVIVLDVSSSIGERTHRQIAHTLASAARTRDRYGLVVFSDSAYEALPPGTPARELRRFEAIFRPLDDAEAAAGRDGLVPLGAPPPRSQRRGRRDASVEDNPRFPPNPWRRSFSGGTRISSGLVLAREVLLRERIANGSVLLVSDLDDDESDIPAVTQAILALREDGVPIRVVGLSPDSRNRTLFARLLGDARAVAAAPVRRAELDERPPPFDRTRPPVWLAAAGALLLVLLALNELWCARLAWRPLRRTPGAPEAPEVSDAAEPASPVAVAEAAG